MKKKLASLLLLVGSCANAMSLDWNGGYRLEYFDISKPTLSTPSGQKQYGLNYLYLTPKIIAADGVNIVSRMNLLAPNSVSYQQSQLGQIIGNGSTAAADQTKPFSQNQGPARVEVSQLYLNINQEFGALVAGRAPLEFGLGITYSAGSGLFDHWYDSHDMLAYKVIIGDWSIMPVFSRVQSSTFSVGHTISDQMWILGYENKDSSSKLGVIQNNRRGTANAIAAGTALPNLPDIGNTLSGVKMQMTNFYFARAWSNFDFKFEAGVQSGQSGYETTGGDAIGVSGYGIATEMLFPNRDKKWDMNLRFGLATGDDPSTPGYEAYLFDRNYDVAFMLFNHRLGQADFMSSNLIKDTAKLSVRNSADDETIANAFYFSPTTKYIFSDKFDLRNTITFAQLVTQPTNSLDFQKDLGLEWDIELIYKPSDNIRWINQLGFLLPGQAFADGASGYDTEMTMGFTSRAAISF